VLNDAFPSLESTPLRFQPPLTVQIPGSTIRSLLPGLLKDLLSMQDILFVGCSLDEPAMKRLFKQVHDIIKSLSAGSQYAARRYILIEKRFQMIKDPVSNADIRVPNDAKEREEEKRFEAMGITVLRYDPDDNHTHLDEILQRLCINAGTYTSQPVKIGYGEDLPE